MVRVRYALSLLLLTALAFAGSASWTNKDPAQWTAADIEKILNDSPWAQQAMASFGTPLEPDDMPVTPPPGASATGMQSGRGVSDGRWDGGIARNTGVGETPSLPITVRWDSALPVRDALSRSQRGAGSAVDERTAKDYVISVLGLVPANTTASPEHPANDPAQIQAFIGNSRLVPRGEPEIVPESAEIDAATGAVHLFFPRAHAITPADKEVTLFTRFGSVRVQKRFRLKDLMYKGRLEL
jgi:hypothetical protein